VDLPRVGRHRGRRLAGFLALGEDLLDVGIGFVHADSMARIRGHFNPLCAT